MILINFFFDGIIFEPHVDFILRIKIYKLNKVF